MDKQSPQVEKTEKQNIDLKTTSKKTKSKLILICIAIIIFIIVGGIVFVLLNKSLQKSLPLVTLSPTPIPLKTEYTNPFDEKSNYENPFAEEEYQNPFDIGE